MFKAKVVGVGFEGQAKIYHFKTDLELKVGDVVVCDTSIGLNLGVVRVSETDVKVSKDIDITKWIVCKIDMTEHRVRLEKEANLQALVAKMEARKKAIDDSSMYAIYADKDPEMKTLFEEFKKLRGE